MFELTETVEHNGEIRVNVIQRELYTHFTLFYTHFTLWSEVEAFASGFESLISGNPLLVTNRMVLLELLEAISSIPLDKEIRATAVRHIVGNGL